MKEPADEERLRSSGPAMRVFDNLIRRWGLPGRLTLRLKPEQLEIEKLRREVAKLKAERDILKKAAAYFAREAI